MRRTVTRTIVGRVVGRVVALVTLGALVGAVVAPTTAGRADAAPGPVTREHLLTRADVESVHPETRDPLRIVLRSPVFAPRGCEDQAQVVRGSSVILASFSPSVRRRSLSMVDHHVVRFSSVGQARSLVQRYRHFSRRCVGDVDTDDGEGGAVRLKYRAWFPPRVGQESAGMLVGWFSRGSADWRRVLVSRVGRTVSVLDVSFTDVRPPRSGVLELGEIAVDRLG
ncbi:hypothetical protein [Nocardioides renjunii]|uniref:hypothetical protein n=1 Tax=Nocardioides renjunii TaxID=3095075 RepID=UPI002AFF0489|nr:hypothetical protein [Nocardioides sp. S-34]WQQ21020.1 hypothetical protein SHK17_14050 [Nocardioides sp. S-34]